MNYYIQGDAANADKIKAAFEKMGYDISWPGGCANPDAINIGVEMNGAKYVVAETSEYIKDIIKTHPDYKELELPIEFKDGDIIGFNDCTHNDGSYIDWVGIYKEKADAEKSHFFHCVITSNKDFRIGILSWRVFTAYPATKEQRDLLFQKMKEAGYQWDADKKELKKIQPHYDIANFQPKQWVLVRQGDVCAWRLDIFSNLKEGTVCQFECVGNSMVQCIPFNDDTKHLLGTTDMCDEQYINW